MIDTLDTHSTHRVGCKFTQKANLLHKTMNTKVPLPKYIVIFISCLPRLKNNILLKQHQSWDVYWWFRSNLFKHVQTCFSFFLVHPSTTMPFAVFVWTANVPTQMSFYFVIYAILLYIKSVMEYLTFQKVKDQKYFRIMVFSYQNCSDIPWEKIVLVMEKNFWNSRLKAENLQNFWDH